MTASTHVILLAATLTAIACPKPSQPLPPFEPSDPKVEASAAVSLDDSLEAVLGTVDGASAQEASSDGSFAAGGSVGGSGIGGAGGVRGVGGGGRGPGGQSPIGPGGAGGVGGRSPLL